MNKGKLLSQVIIYRKKIIKYLHTYGIRNFISKAFQIARSGGLAYYGTIVTKTRDSIDFSGIQPEVLLVTNDFNSPSHEYRIANLSQALWEIGVTNSILGLNEIRILESIPRQTNLIIFWRTNLNLLEFPWYLNAKKDGVTIAFDSDDLTFERATFNRKNVNSLNFIPTKEADFLIHEVARDQELQVTQSTLGIACTPELSKAFGRLGIKSRRIPIVLPRWMENEGVKHYRNKKHYRNNLNPTKKSGIDIIYCSGSRSHNVDFTSASKGVFEFLTRNPDSTLTIQGASPISVEDIPWEIRGQINFHPMLSHRNFLEYLSIFDVQIAPLELGNPFVESKSATKFMQGGIVGVPTVATPTQPFIECIQHGINGYLASTPNEWIEALNSLKNYEIRRKIADLAHIQTLDLHCVGSILEETSDLIRECRAGVLNKQKEKFTSNVKPSKIVWLLPKYIPGSGGHRNVFRIANLIEGSEFHSQVFFHEDTRNDSILSELIRKNYGNFNFEVISTKSKILEADFVVGVHNSSIPFARLNASKRATLVYLVQDFEPWFSPMGTLYLDALSTYFYDDLHLITSGEWMSRKIQEILGFAPPYFSFPVDKTVYKSEDKCERNGIVFFAKSDTPRRLFELGIETLTTLHRQHPELPITIFGSDQRLRLGFKHLNLNLVPSLDELSRIYSTHKLGMAFSPTNPSLVPYEMMSCGLPVLDIDIPGSPMNKYGGNQLLEPPIYGRGNLISKANKLLGDEEIWKATSFAGLEFTKTLPTPQQASEVVIAFFRKLRDTGSFTE